MSSEHFRATRVIALALVSTSAWLSITLLPYEVSALSVGYHVGTAGAGWIAAAELLALACAASYVGQSIGVRDKRRLTILGLSIAIGATIGCLVTDHVVVLIGLRLLFGVGTGIIAAATNALPALHSNPGRLFAYMQLALGVVFGLALFAVGAVESFAGRGAVFFVDLLFLLTLAPVAFLLPRGVVVAAHPSKTRMNLQFPEGAVSALAALSLMWIAQGALWAWAIDVGMALHSSSDSGCKYLSRSRNTASFRGPFLSQASSFPI